VTRTAVTLDPTVERKDEVHGSRRVWAALMLARSVDTCASILAGNPVRAGTLDAAFLRCALRGAPLPDPNEFVLITYGMLNPVDESGPIE
jgi:hypothetical protein